MRDVVTGYSHAGKTQQNKQGLLFSKWGPQLTMQVNGDLVSPLSQGPQNFMKLLLRLFLVLSASYPPRLRLQHWLVGVMHCMSAMKGLL